MKTLLHLTAAEIEKLKKIIKTHGKENKKNSRESYNFFKFVTNEGGGTVALATTGSVLNELPLLVNKACKNHLVIKYSAIETLPENRDLVLVEEGGKFFLQDNVFRIEIADPTEFENFILIEKARKNIADGNSQEITLDLKFLDFLLLSKERVITIRLEKEPGFGTPVFEVFDGKNKN